MVPASTTRVRGQGPACYAAPLGGVAAAGEGGDVFVVEEVNEVKAPPDR